MTRSPMRFTRLILYALLAVGAACAAIEPAPGAEDSVAIVGATVIHPERDGATASEADSTIVISGRRIVAVGRSSTVAVPAKSTVIDARGKWVVPGLVDGHVHFFQSGNLYTRPDAADFNKWMPYAKEVARNKARLPATFRVWLASGVTSVVDIGGPMWNFEMRDDARRIVAAPRVAVAGPLVSTIDDPPLDLGDPPIAKTTSAAEALARRNHALYCPTLFVFTSYELALSGTWRPTPAEQRLADPRILAAMGDLEKIPKDMLPPRVVAFMANPREVKEPPAAMANLRK